MKIFTNKNLIQKLIIAIVAVTLLEFCIAPIQVKAATIGGTLAKPIRDLAVTIGDALISLTQYGLMGTWIDAVEHTTKAKTTGGKDFWAGKVRYPQIQLSPELIFANKVEILDADFITTSNSNKSYIIKASTDGAAGSETNALGELRKIIASWYVTLRTISVVGLLSVLMYIGIRIIISSTGQDKAKYKQRLIDWIVAFCLLFFMHYIMIGIITIVGELNDALSKSFNIGAGIKLDSAYGNVIYDKSTEDTLVEDEHKDVEIQDWLSSHGYTNIVSDTNYATNETIIEFEKNGKKYRVTVHQDPQTMKYDSISETGIGYSKMPDFNDMYNDVMNGASSTQQPQQPSQSQPGSANVGMDNQISGAVETTNRKGQKILVSADAESSGSTILYFINYARLYCNANADYNAVGFGFTAIYIILVSFTIMFTFRYAKRVIYIAFLTMIAPLVALTYPLDKIKDGRAQAFNMWVREYIFNILIQPFHLLIYTILVGSATSLAQQHMIYAVVAIAFLIPAEKLLRKFFGFDNAGTLSAAGSFAGGAIFSQMVSKINRPKSKGGSNTEGRDTQKPIRKASGQQVDEQNILKEEAYQVQRQNTNVRRQANQASYTTGNASNKGTENITWYTSNNNTGTQNTGWYETNDVGTNDVGTNARYNDNNTSWYQPNGTGNVIVDIDSETESDSRDDSEVNNLPPEWANENRVTFWDRLSGAKGKYTADDIHLSNERMAGKSEEEIQKIKEKEAKRRNRIENVDNLTDAIADHYKGMAINGVKSLPQTAGRMVRRGVVGGVAGGALALTGAAIGAASGSPGDAMKYALAGAGAGYYGANYYGDKVAKDAGQALNEAETAFWGEQAKARQQYLFDEEFKKNAKNIEALTKVLGSRAEAKEAMNDGTVQALLNNNITDVNKMAKAVALQRKYARNGMDKWQATERAVKVAKWNRDSGKAIYETNSRAQEVFMNRTIKQTMKANPGMTSENAEKLVKDLFNDMVYFET